MLRLASACALILLFASGGAAAAADTVTGTLTVSGKTHLLKHVYVTRTPNPGEPGSKYLVMLATDVPVAAEDRTRARLTALAKAGKVHAVRVAWKEGFDTLIATPFHGAVADNGQPTTGGAELDLRAYDESRLDAQINSKALGQDWHFNARLQATVVAATAPADDFAAPVPVLAPTGVERERNTGSEPVERGVTPVAAKDATAAKRTLGRHGYAYTAEAFTQAVKDGHLDAVQLFLQLGMNPNTADDGGHPALMSAVMQCTTEPAASRVTIVQALLAAKAAVDPKDGNGSTPLLWSVTAQCPTEIARALIGAGANVNVKAKGGGTPLMLATVFKRTDLIDLLKQAGAKQ